MGGLIEMLNARLYGFWASLTLDSSHRQIQNEAKHRGDLPRAELLIMGMIPHDRDLPTKRMLIGKAYAALENEGSLIVYRIPDR